jgi:uncharacterized membrane protein YheB (UPF0754 family)
MLLEVLIKTITGAVVGYTTNDMAIQMLFRKRFGLGGIFLKTKDEFIDNISKVVEQDIINHHTIEEELGNDNFSKAIEQTVRSYFEQALYNSVDKKVQLADVPAIDQSFENIREVLLQTLPKTLSPLINDLLSDVKIMDFASEQQLNVVSQRLTGAFIEKTEYYSVIRQFVRSSYEELGDIPFSNVIYAEMLEQFADSAAHLTKNAHELFITKYADDAEKLIDDAYKSLDVDALLKSIAQSLSKKSLYELLGRENTKQIAQEILSQLQEIIVSEEGEKILDNFSNFLINSLEAEEKTLFELVSSDISENIRSFFRKQFPPILIKIISWLYSRKDELEVLIDSSFQNNVDSKLKGWLVNTFVGSVSQSANIINKMAEVLEVYHKNPDKIAKTLSEQIVSYLNEQSIGSMVKGLKNQNTVLTLSKILQKNITDGLKRLDINTFDYLFEKEIGDFFSTEKIETFLQKNVHNLIDVELKKKVLFDKRSSLLISSTVQQKILDANSLIIKDLVSPDAVQNLAIRAEIFALQTMRNHESSLHTFLTHNISQPLKDKNLTSLISAQQLSDFSGFLVQSSDEYLLKQFNKRKQNQLHTYFRLLNRIPNLYPDLSSLLQVAFMDNLPTLMTGRIEAIVRNNLQHQSPNQIRDLVEKFMGKELKPITQLGALWGAIAGGVLSFMPTFQNLALQLGIPALAYGATGMGTNWIALKMVFQPYTQKKFPLTNIPVPLTPGVTVKNQGRFAINMGKFVGQRLMNKDGIGRSFSSNKVVIKNSLLELIRKDDYSNLDKFLLEQKGDISQKIVKNLSQYVLENKESLIDKAKTILDDYKEKNLSSLDTAFIERKIIDYSQNPATVSLISKELLKLIDDFVDKNEKLVDVMPPNLKESLYGAAEKLTEKEVEYLFENINNPELIDRLIQNLNKQFDKNIHQKVTDFLSDKQRADIQTNFSDYLYKELNKDTTKELVFGFLNKQIIEQINPERKIKEVLDGSLLRFVNKNIDFVIQKVLGSVIIWLGNNSEVLAKQVYDKAFEEQKAVFLYKDAIQNTVKDLAQNGIPLFIQREQESITQIIDEEIVRLGEVPLQQIGIEANKDYLEDIISKLIANPKTKYSVEQLTFALLQSFFDIPLNTFLQLTDIQSLTDLQELLQSEISLAGSHLKGQYFKGRKNILASVNSLLHKIIEEVISKTETATLVEGISKDDLRSSIERIVRLLTTSEAFDTQSRRLTSKLFQDLKQQAISEIVDWDILHQDMEKLLSQRLEAVPTQQTFSDTLARLLEKNISSINQNIDKKTKDYISETLADAAVNILEERLADLLESIDIHKVVVDEINKMPPQEIESLFNSFSKKYFDQLIRYGFGFGIALGMALDFAAMQVMVLLKKGL